MPVSVTTRQIELKDIDAFYAVRASALEQSPQSYGNHLEQWRSAPQAQVVSMIEDALASPDNAIVGAFADGALLGMGGLNRERKLNVVHKATLWGLFVVPEQRRKGIGRQILGHVIEIARGVAGLDYVRLIVTATDEPARALFESVGFAEYGNEQRGIRHEGKYYDQVYMRFDLGPPAA